MRLITRQTLADKVADKWDAHYKNHTYRQDKTNTLERLRALGESPLPDSVDMIIGNNSWTRTECHECGAENVEVVEVGEVLDYATSTANVCKSCLENALAL